jgi:hypothetical protein
MSNKLEHEELYREVLDALDNLFFDDNVDQKVIRNDLKDLIIEIRSRLDSLV